MEIWRNASLVFIRFCLDKMLYALIKGPSIALASDTFSPLILLAVKSVIEYTWNNISKLILRRVLKPMTINYFPPYQGCNDFQLDYSLLQCKKFIHFIRWNGRLCWLKNWNFVVYLLSSYPPKSIPYCQNYLFCSAGI